MEQNAKLSKNIETLIISKILILKLKIGIFKLIFVGFVNHICRICLSITHFMANIRTAVNHDETHLNAVEGAYLTKRL